MDIKKTIEDILNEKTDLTIEQQYNLAKAIAVLSKTTGDKKTSEEFLNIFVIEAMNKRIKTMLEQYRKYVPEQNKRDEESLLKELIAIEEFEIEISKTKINIIKNFIKGE